jgi:coenzyme F420 hydrogenase subunit beta
VCPRFNVSLPLLEELVFGRTRNEDEPFGIYRRIVIAQTKDKKILRICQDGGIVTSLLVHALEEGIIDSAVLSGVTERQPLKAFPVLATNPREIVKCAGTRYTYSPSMFALKEGVLKKKKNIAFVGTPDQILALRRFQAIPLSRFSRVLAFNVGVFCSECFNYDGLVKILNQRKLNPSKVKGLNIKGKLQVTTVSGKTVAIRLNEMKRHASNCVSTCSDFSGELADISVGGVGLDKWTFVVLRTEKGEEIFRKFENEGIFRTRHVVEGERSLELLVKLSKRKRNNVLEMGYESAS